MAFARFINVMFERSVAKSASSEQRRVATSWMLNISIPYILFPPGIVIFDTMSM